MPGTNGVQNYYIFTNFVQSGQRKSKRKYYHQNIPSNNERINVR